jgi:hypothetical protein
LRQVESACSVITKTVKTVTTAPVILSSTSMTTISQGSAMNENSNARAASTANPMSSSGLRPQTSDQYPIQGAKSHDDLRGVFLRDVRSISGLMTLSDEMVLSAGQFGIWEPEAPPIGRMVRRHQSIALSHVVSLAR